MEQAACSAAQIQGPNFLSPAEPDKPNGEENRHQWPGDSRVHSFHDVRFGHLIARL